jgi:hypothetical protein
MPTANDELTGAGGFTGETALILFADPPWVCHAHSIGGAAFKRAVTKFAGDAIDVQKRSEYRD